jgi:signal transduction histidine kinase
MEKNNFSTVYVSSRLEAFFPVRAVAAKWAKLRYRLFDGGRFINRTLVYGTLTAIIVGVYVLAVSSLGILFEMETGSLTISLLITGLIAVCFQPLRARLQQGINRLMYGERDDPYAVLSRFGQRLEATLAPEAVLPTIVETVAQALKLSYVAIALKQDDKFVVAAAHGSSQDNPATLPLIYQGEAIGQLLVIPRLSGRSFTPADWRLLEGLAHQAGIAAHGVRLTIDLQRSREQLVTAREEERRRLQRDLHDGLGPALAALMLKLDAARNLLKYDPVGTDVLLFELKNQIQATIKDIRRLVYGLRPPALNQLGLISAIREHAASLQELNGLRISIEVPERLPPLPAAVEVVAYRIVQEALTNVTSHAQAHTCIIRLRFDSSLYLDICDDGLGLPRDCRAGVGLTSMRERASELGGTCVVTPGPVGGTCVRAYLPIKQSNSKVSDQFRVEAASKELQW